MYVSKIKLKRKVLPDSNTYPLHQDIWTLFPEHNTEKSIFLYRVNYDYENLKKNINDDPEILLVSKYRPAASSRKATVLATKPYNPQPQKEQVLQFELVGNPIKKLTTLISDNTSKKSQVITPLTSPNDQIKWLHRVLKGSTIIQSAIIEKHIHNFTKNDKECAALQMVRFSGILKVEDPQILKQLLTDGVGSKGRAFGCGLLTVRRLS